jgi:hypothetical protein
LYDEVPSDVYTSVSVIGKLGIVDGAAQLVRDGGGDPLLP